MDRDLRIRLDETFFLHLTLGKAHTAEGKAHTAERDPFIRKEFFLLYFKKDEEHQ